jgi:uncharacterized protein YutE (UPF0331/DUF86 family)
MINREVVDKHLEDMATRVTRLRTCQKASFTEFVDDWKSLYAVEHALQTAIQSLIDIGAHILASRGDSKWNEYREIPLRLARLNIIPKTEVKTLQEMIGMRNILVHQYIEIDSRKVYGIIRDHIDDFDRFAKSIKRYVVEEASQ